MISGAFTVVSLYATSGAGRTAAGGGIGNLADARARVTETAWGAQLGGLKDHLAAPDSESPQLLPRDSLAWALHGVEIGSSEPGRPTARYPAVEWGTRVFAIPYAGLVIALVARAEGDLDAAIALLNVTFFRRQHITVDTHGQDGRGPLVKEVNRRLAETWAGAPTLQHKLDAHQLLILPDLQLLSVPSATSVDPRLLRHALFRGEESTAEFSTVIRPPAANRSPRALVALRVSVTVVAGLAPHLVAGLELSTAQSIAGLARSREIRREAYDALQAARTIDPGDRGTPTDRAPAPAGGAPSLVDLGQRLGTAEYELSFGVRANTDIGLLVPVAEVTEYHAALSTIVGLDRGLQVSESLLGSLARAVEALRDRTTERARARQELVERRLALFAAALLLPGLVAATVAAVPHSTQGRVTLAMLMVSTVFVPALVYLAVQQRAESARTGSANRAAWMRDATMGASGGAQETARPASSAHSSAAR